MQRERLSLTDKMQCGGYSNHIQRYTFASEYCRGKRVLDAGCGTGYGSTYLMGAGAASVTGVDIADEALAEANQLYRRDNLRFVKGDLERLAEIPELKGPFDVAVNLENIEHLRNPALFLTGVRQQLTSEGILVVSSPNGEITQRDETGRICNPFHFQEFTDSELRKLLEPHFGSIEVFGQWQTPERLTRLDFERRLFDNLCELYYNPVHRLWRLARKLLRMPCAPPPQYSAAGTAFPGEFAIKPICPSPFPWPPDVILAVCRP